VKKRTLSIAFYKGDGSIIDKVIRKWTKSSYSHVEILINTNNFFSSSWRDKGVRYKVFIPAPKNWDIYELSVLTEEQYNSFISFFMQTCRCKYDLTNIFLTQFISLNLENPNKYICSEWCGTVLDLLKIVKVDLPYKYNPENLFQLLRSQGFIKNEL